MSQPKPQLQQISPPFRLVRALLILVSLLGVLAAPSGAQALEEVERELLLRSIRPGQLKRFEKQLGSLESLPLVAVELKLALQTRKVTASLQIDWKNRGSKALSHLVYRLPAQREGSEGSGVSFSELKISFRDTEAVAVSAEVLGGGYFRVPLPRPLRPQERILLQGSLNAELEQISESSLDPANDLDFSAILSQLLSSPGSSPSKKDTTPNSEAKSQYGTLACGAGICTVFGAIPEVPALINNAFDTTPMSSIGDPAYSEPVNLIMSVVSDEHWDVAAPGVEVGRVSEGDGQQRLTFALAAAREIGFVASKAFVLDEVEVKGVKIRSFSRIEHQAAGRRVLEVSQKTLQTFDEAFGPYPWSTLVLAESALTGGAAGMEHGAMILMGTSFYDTPPIQLTISDPSGRLWGEILDFITRHEVAHQWWHAQVGSHPQLHPYIDEPLAQWSALYATEQDEGKAVADRAREYQVLAGFRSLRFFGASDGIVARPAGEFSSQMEYAGLIYGKAPMFYERLRELIGTPALLQALRSLVHSHQFSRLTPQALKRSLLGASKKDQAKVEALWRRWFEQEHGVEDLGELSLDTLIKQSEDLDSLPPELQKQLENLKPEDLLHYLNQLKDFMNVE